MQLWQEIMSVVISNGVFAILFVLLFCYQLKDSRRRENKYQETIDELSKHIGVVREIKEDVEELKTLIRKPPKERRTKKDKQLIVEEILEERKEEAKNEI